MKTNLLSLLFFVPIAFAANPVNDEMNQIVAQREANLAQKALLIQQQRDQGIKHIHPLDLAKAQIELYSYRRDHTDNLDTKIQLQEKIVDIAHSVAKQVEKNLRSSTMDALDNNQAQALYLSSRETLLQLKKEKALKTTNLPSAK